MGGALHHVQQETEKPAPMDLCKSVSPDENALSSSYRLAETAFAQKTILVLNYVLKYEYSI